MLWRNLRSFVGEEGFFNIEVEVEEGRKVEIKRALKINVDGFPSR